MSAKKVRLGVVGCGGFGMFAVQQFIQDPRIELAAIGGTTRREAEKIAARYGVEHTSDAAAVFDNPDVDLVYINTPPSLHAPQCEAALAAGKHVIVEKPLAVKLSDGERLVRLAESKGLVCVANLMQRYNPVTQRVAAVLESGALGEPLYASLENHAVDEGLATEHWFWDLDISGGIFIEHGVHFFDLAAWWFGDLKILSAGASQRPSDDKYDQVWCDARSGSGALFRFYHGFNQPSRLERQAWRLTCERGTIEMHGWIPLEIHIEALVTDATTRTLTQLLPGYRLNVYESLGGPAQKVRGHGVWSEVDQKVTIDWSPGIEKHPLYCELLRRMLDDQLTYIADRSHRRMIGEQNGLASLRLAVESTRAAGLPIDVT